MRTERSLIAALRASRSITNLHVHRGYEDWGTYDSGIDSYTSSFYYVVDRRPIVELLHGVQDPVVVDLMSSSEAVAGLFQQLPRRRRNRNRLGIALSRADNRNDETKARDEGLGIQQLIGDLTYPSGWNTVEEALGGRKANLILIRPVLTENLPRHEAYYGYALQRAWNMLGEGTILTETPSYEILQGLGISLRTYVQVLNSSGIRARADLANPNGGYLRLDKNSSSPLLLPAYPR